MQRIYIYILAGMLVFIFACKKIDNYDAPGGGIYGTLTDQVTGEPLQSEQPNGYTIRLFEKSGSMNSPISFQGKADGTYENAMIFRNEYKVIPCEGAFFPLDTVSLKIDARTELNFEVIPFLTVEGAAVASSAGKITANYKITRPRAADKIVERETLVSSIPTVNSVVYDFRAVTDLSGTNDTDILAASCTDEITGLVSGKTYYVRIAVRTNNELKRYNYSKVFQVVIP